MASGLHPATHSPLHKAESSSEQHFGDDQRLSVPTPTTGRRYSNPGQESFSQAANILLGSLRTTEQERRNVEINFIHDAAAKSERIADIEGRLDSLKQGLQKFAIPEQFKSSDEARQITREQIFQTAGSREKMALFGDNWFELRDFLAYKDLIDGEDDYKKKQTVMKELLDYRSEEVDRLVEETRDIVAQEAGLNKGDILKMAVGSATLTSDYDITFVIPFASNPGSPPVLARQIPNTPKRAGLLKPLTPQRTNQQLK